MTSDEWIIDHFDIHAPELGAHLHDTLARARELCPIARSDVYHGGYWVATRYEDVLRIAQDWETWSNQLGISVGPDGIEAPSTLEAGYYLIEFSSAAEYWGYMNIMVPPADLSQEEATELALAAARGQGVARVQGARDLIARAGERVGVRGGGVALVGRLRHRKQRGDLLSGQGASVVAKIGERGGLDAL